MMHQKGLVSVIIPTYNRAELCQKSVESALAQTYRPLEIIVVDDGSTDDTEEKIKGLHPSVHYIRQKNAGVVAARNCAMKHSRGEYIAFLDSDDEWLPWKIECQVAVLEKIKNAGMVWTDMSAIDFKGVKLFDSYLKRMYSAYRYFDKDTHFKERYTLDSLWGQCPDNMKRTICYAGDIYKWMFMGNLVHTSTALMRRDRQQQVGYFNEELTQSGEDYEYHLRTCQFGDVAYIDIPSILYRIDCPDQLTSPQHMVWIARNNLKTVMTVLESNHAKVTLPEKMIQHRLAESYAWVAEKELFENGAETRKNILQSLRIDFNQMSLLPIYLLSFLPTSLIISLRRWKHKLAK